MNPWVLGGDFLNCGNGFQAVSTGFFLTSCYWEGKCVDDDVFNSHVPLGN